MHIESVDLNLLKALDVLLEERHVSRAAARFHLSQPAMSRTLGRLRDVFGDELLVRTATGYVLTPRARHIRAELSEILPRLRSLVTEENFDPSTAVGKIRVAASDYFLAVMGNQVLPDFFGQASGISLVVETVSPTTFDDLERGHLDLAFVPTPTPPHLCRHVLFTEDHVCVMAEDHPLTRDRLTPADLAEYPHVGVAALKSDRMLVEAQLEQLGIRPHPGLSVPYFTAAVAAVRGTQLIAVLPRRLVARLREPGLRVAEAPAQFSPFDYAMLWHPRLTRDPALQWLRSLLIRAGAALTPRTGPDEAALSPAPGAVPAS
ncbi:LysR family transcriptional regulator [Streptomyces iconiensis]|uniref:LysR family transcriptional regulator n=1 Tax=Streptomyces iconiensis TaxID=1384038 RepID=A0ABT7A1D7_9ACTN|nr:LysR family transcriptional regulator [Streptomyces iconiensis]MDJ1135155.1 LysR family transcriptional regulator [Streptomyces iconiensis]